jgi:hypothetical protein
VTKENYDFFGLDVHSEAIAAVIAERGSKPCGTRRARILRQLLCFKRVNLVLAFGIFWVRSLDHSRDLPTRP